MSNELATIKDYVSDGLNGIAGSMPQHLTPERALAIVVGAVQKSPLLLQCTKQSIWACVRTATLCGLEIDVLGSAYLVPFRNNKTNNYEAQLIIGYQGLIDLCRRSGNIKTVSAFPVYEGDLFEVSLGTSPIIKHLPKYKSGKRNLFAVYAVAEFTDGVKQFEVMTLDEVDLIRARSKAGKSQFSPWSNDYTEMARKTVVRRLVKYLPKSIEMQRAITAEENPVTINAEFSEPPQTRTSQVKQKMLGISPDDEIVEPEPEQLDTHEPTDREKKIIHIREMIEHNKAKESTLCRAHKKDVFEDMTDGQLETVAEKL